jgi:hypothetical protein
MYRTIPRLAGALAVATILAGCLTDREATVGGIMPTAASLTQAGDARRASGDLAGGGGAVPQRP